MFKKKEFLLIALFLFIFCMVSCKNKDNSAEDSMLQNSTSDSEMILSETEYLAETVEESSLSSKEETRAGMTNREFLRLIINTFEIYSDESFEGDVEEAKFWNILDADVVIEENEVITPEFLISASMIATGYVDHTASMEEILDCAVKYKVIEKANIASVDINNAQEIVKAAKHAYLYPDMY